MEKLSTEKVAGILRQVGPVLRAQSEEIADLKEKLAGKNLRERAEKIASQMDAKNLEPDLSHAEKVDRLLQNDDLDVVEKAIDMSAQQVKLASVSDEPGSDTDARTAFETALFE